MHHLDTLGMWEATVGLPEQLERALGLSSDAFGGSQLTAARGVEQVVLLGVGSLAGAADAVVAYAAPRSAVPVVAVQDSLPAFVGPKTLVIASSHSGSDPGPVTAAVQALERGATVVTVNNGGALGDLATAHGLVTCPLAPEAPNARSAWGASVVSSLVALAGAGIVADPAAALRSAAASAGRRSEDWPSTQSPPGVVARQIGRTFPLLYGAGNLGAVAAHRWKAQINENVKTPAFAADVSLASHHDVVGWGQHGDVTRQLFTLVALRHSGETPESSGLFEAVLAATDEVMAGVLTVEADGEDDLSRLFDLVLFGDFVSLHMAAREDIDPGPVGAWTELGAAAR
jgi:glucose/mannose-6-phosphate isomerase